MKLLNFKINNESKIGVKTENGILDLNKAALQFNEQASGCLDHVIQQNDLSTIKRLVEAANYDNFSSLYLNEEEVEIQPTVLNPEKIVCVGLNYLEHIEESEESRAIDVPKEPILFSKYNNALAAHNENIPLPKQGEKFDYEAELVIVIGKEAQDVSEEEALSYVFGYSVGNDLSVRDLQFKSGQWLLGKTTDKFAPVGPYLVTADEIDPTNLNISMKRNGEIVQSSNTKHMIFNCATIISYVSKYMTLKPGDLIFTGTPEGVILGQPENERVWLKPGDELEVAIENIGTLKNVLV